PMVPQGYHAKLVHGFVEELVVSDDPEYQWIDKIRTPRASNEARQTLFFKLSGELQRKIGVKTLELGGNAVIGYKQSYDLEGESGIVARGIGSAVTLVKSVSFCPPTTTDDIKEEHVKNYLEFVGDGKGFCLNNTPNALFPFPHSLSPCDILPTAVTPKYRQLSKRLYSSLDTSNQISSRSSENVSEPSSMKTLFKQESERGKSGYKLTHKIKKLKNPQNYSLSKKMLVLKSKLSDSIGEESDDNTSLSGKKKHFKRSTSDSSFMAEVLARSVIHAHNSLSCILEVRNPSHDEEESENTLNKLEPLANLLGKTVSEPFIGSDSECCFSSTDSSSSGSDYDEDDDEDINYKNSDKYLDTISNIVKDVEMLQLKQGRPRLQKQFSLPALGPNRVDSLASLSENVYKLEEFAGGSAFELGFQDKSNECLDFAQSIEDNNNKEQIIENIKNNEEAAKLVEKNDVSDFHGIGPEAVKGVEIKNKGLIKTAMQAMLLDKVNIMGTYTPPTSPSIKSTSSNVSEQTSVQPKDQFNFPQLKGRIPKSASSVSFADYVKQKDTVLGVPFTSLFTDEYFKKRQSHPCRLDVLSSTQTDLGPFRKKRPNCFSDNQLNNPVVKTMLDESLQKKKLSQKFKIFNLKRNTCSHESSLNDQKKLFGFLPRSRKSSESDKKDKGSIITRIFSIKNKEKLSLSSNISFSSSSQINSSSSQINLTDTNNSPSNLPVNTKIEQGDSYSNTKHACITPNRHNMSPQPEQNGSNCQQNAEQQRNEQSPAKVHSLHHRRSSDSDLSITPKGNSLTGSDKSGGQPSGCFMRNNIVLPSKIHQENFDMLEYPFLTILKFPPDFISQIGK
ncbi:C2 domain-containing protein 5, partial [Gonioctena quinquepunctata]